MRQNAGTSLLEMILYAASFTVLLSLSLTLYVQTSRLAEAGQNAVDRVSMASALDDDFRNAVREAKGVRAALGPYRTDGQSLVLDMGLAAQGDRRYLVIGNLEPKEAAPALTFAHFTETPQGLSLEKTARVPLAMKTVEITSTSRSAMLTYMPQRPGRGQRAEEPRRVTAAFRAPERGVLP